MSDELVKKLLHLLENNCRFSTSALAAMCGVSEDTVRDTLTLLENNGTIIGYHTVINWGKMKSPQVTAMIEVNIVPQRDVGFNRIAERIGNFPEVKALYLMSGTYDLLAEVQAPTMQDIGDFVSYKLSTIDGVQGTVSHFLMKRYKEDGLVFEQHESDTRLAVMP